MKKLILILIPLFVVSLLAAIPLDFDGDFRTRAALYNSVFENNSGHVDSRLWLGMDADLHEDLTMRATLQFGDVTWGNGATGGGITSAVNVCAYELYIDYRMHCIDSNIRIGQQYWADPMSLIIDDTFSGVMLTKDNFMGFQTEFGWVKALELGRIDNDDNYFLINMQTPNPQPWGFFASYYQMGSSNDDSITLMPYMSFDADPIQVDAALFAGMHFNSPEDDAFGIGAAVKASADLGVMNVGGDLLVSTENGIATLSPYYQNGLFIYGINTLHDGVSLYWGVPYSWNNDFAMSLVGKFSMPLGNSMTAFAHAGYLLDAGIEVNGGVDCVVIPELLNVSGYIALGQHEGERVSWLPGHGRTNYVVGSTLSVIF